MKSASWHSGPFQVFGTNRDFGTNRRMRAHVMYWHSLCTPRKAQLHFTMMTSSNGNIFHVAGPLYGEFTGHRWIPCTKASDAELWCFLWSALLQLHLHSRLIIRLQWIRQSMMTSSNGNIFRFTGPLCGEFTGLRWIPLTSQWLGALMFSLICTRINAWVNNSKAGD